MMLNIWHQIPNPGPLRHTRGPTEASPGGARRCAADKSTRDRLDRSYRWFPADILLSGSISSWPRMASREKRPSLPQRILHSAERRKVRTSRRVNVKTAGVEARLAFLWATETFSFEACTVNAPTLVPNSAATSRGDFVPAKLLSLALSSSVHRHGVLAIAPLLSECPHSNREH
jgi:hypothetical protein